MSENLTYQAFIDNILQTRGRFACGDEYHERHHIVPKCLGGTNEENNLIDLFAREHFEAHRLLALEHPENSGLQYAWWNMCQIQGNDEQDRYIPTAEEFEQVRKICSKLSSEKNSGKNHPMFGLHHTDQTKEKMSKAHKGQLLGEKNPMYGKKHTQAQKQAVSDWAKEWHKNNVHPMTGVQRFGKDNPMYGKHLSDETKQKLREQFSGGNNPYAKKIKCGDEIYNTLQAFCNHWGLKSSTVSSWLHRRNPMPQEWIERGLAYYVEGEQ
jgi:hypothetical protein